jgi:4-hydroxy-3-polyprenylbenzoate decarboxylase
MTFSFLITPLLNIFTSFIKDHMSYSGLREFIHDLEACGELQRIHTFADPELEITEITDRVTKTGGKALLFEENGTGFPLLINAFGSDKRMSMALGRKNPDETGNEIEKIFAALSGKPGNLFKKISHLPELIRLARLFPVKSPGWQKGKCQQVIHKIPDLGILPVLKCWPYDGGRFITLPVVHTVHPVTGATNAGMYRMQILDKNTTGMHWQLHKTGANHFEAWKQTGEKMPVTVTLGGDPVYAYSATAPLPENLDEYILAGFLRKKRVRLVKCISNDLYIPEDCDIVIEGYVDPAEDLVMEGPFGDHTGFYSLADLYPRFHVTTITHSHEAVYPATIVGIPPQEDAFLARATEKIFLAPIKLTLQPEIEDIHMPDAGVAHNLVIVKIRKSYSGQGMKVINSLLGAGQMMFTKYIIVVDGAADIRDYKNLASQICLNTDFRKDLVFSRGPLDVLDHSSDTFAFGGKLGIDATVKTAAEKSLNTSDLNKPDEFFTELFHRMIEENLICNFNSCITSFDLPVLILSVDNFTDANAVRKLSDSLLGIPETGIFRIIFVVDQTVDVGNLFTVAWHLLANSDPLRDHLYIGSSLLIDGTIKAFRQGGFTRRWPNVVCSDPNTIKEVDDKWNILGLGELIRSPSGKVLSMKYNCDEEVKR